MRSAIVVLLLAAVCSAQSPEGDASLYHVSPVGDLAVEGGALPPTQSSYRWHPRRPLPFAVLDGAGEAFLARDPGRVGALTATHGTLALRVPGRRDVTGRLFLQGEDLTLVEVRFTVPADDLTPDDERAFLETARDDYAARLSGGRPGAAWWRHRADELSRALGEDEAPDTPAARNPARTTTSNMDDTYALFTGGRAVAENLQLDRILPASPDVAVAVTVDIDDVQGITVEAYDWSAAVAEARPALDPLAARIPHDQHAIFFPSFQALVDVADHADEQGTPVLQALSDPSGEAGTKERTQRQLGLPLSDLARLLGPTVIESVAITGGDPYLRTGSDVAVLFQPKDADLLHTLVLVRVAAAVAEQRGVETGQGELDGFEYVVHRSPGREVCSYVARLDDAIVVTNSEVQLRRLVEVSGGAPALAALPEYVFFRDRYARGDPGESALVVVSDATIRRWCGPRWRIGSSRRTRAEAALAEVQARALARVASGAAGAAVVLDPPAGIGDVVVSASGARSSVYGTLGFMTPVGELDLDVVTEEEAQLYGRWRDGYQRNWSGVFDPIAVRLGVGPERLELDVTVRPLIAGSEYREFIDLARNATIAPQAGDPHGGTLAHWVLAIDRQAVLLGEPTSMLKMMMPQLDPIGWLGQSVALYVDDDPFWEELGAAEDPEAFLEEHWMRLPVAIHAEVGDPMLLTAFLVAARGLIEQSAPDMTVWENGEHAGEPYVMIRPSPRAVADEDVPDGFALRYAASGDGLLVTLSQSVLERALERRVARRAARAEQAAGESESADGVAKAKAKAKDAAGPASSAWLGRHLCLAIEGSWLTTLDRAMGRADGADALRRASFANLPILNEWHRLHPDVDPVVLHERLWNRRLLCPGGGDYVWNEAWQTMESTVYGHPGAPRPGPALPPALLRLVRASAGLTFEDDGLRARARIERSR